MLKLLCWIHSPVASPDPREQAINIQIFQQRRAHNIYIEACSASLQSALQHWLVKHIPEANPSQPISAMWNTSEGQASKFVAGLRQKWVYTL